MSKLNLDLEKIKASRTSAKNIAEDVQAFIDLHTTVSTERTVVRLLGVDGVDEIEKPLANVVVDNIVEGGGLERGAAYWMGNAMVKLDLSPQEIAEKIAIGQVDITRLPAQNDQDIKDAVVQVAKKTMKIIDGEKKIRQDYIKAFGPAKTPNLYVIVATGNIHEDIVQARAAGKQGADIVAVIRTTGQSLLDYVPYGATTEGFGGTYATQENFRLMRQALDEVGEAEKRYIKLTNYCSGLCMPEIAAMGAVERVDMMLNDALYGILFRDINMQRTLVDQYFSRLINGYAGIIINTGEDNYLTTDDAVDAAHTVLASQFINEQFALKAGLPQEQMGLGHAFEIEPTLEDGFLLELAQAQMAREIFPQAPLKYMPPTKFMTGNIFKGHIQNTMFNMVSIMTGQGIQLLGMLTEAIHTPHIHDRYLAIENAQYVFNNARHLADEIEFKEGGVIQNRAKKVLADATDLLEQIEKDGLFQTIEGGRFGGVRRSRTGGKGLAGVCVKDKGYFNPFIELMLGGER